ncbi:hypothetical protein EDD16DRAFT_1594518 [Pisolithus croceorrhizus]|nr:hypothetical protein EDD16DRAFT_1594518 [Pisolithus croceorrhizus]
MDSIWLDEGKDAAKAPDEGSQHVGDEVKEDEDLPQTSSEALETQGNPPFTTSERAETRAGHRKPENEVVDMQQVVDVLPMFESRDLPEMSCKALDPVDSIVGQTARRSLTYQIHPAHPLNFLPHMSNTLDYRTGLRHECVVLQVAPHVKPHLTRLRGRGCLALLEWVGGTAQWLGQQQQSWR